MQEETDQIAWEQMPLPMLCARLRDKRLEVLQVSAGLCAELNMEREAVVSFWSQPIRQLVHADDCFRTARTIAYAAAHPGEREPFLCRILLPQVGDEAMDAWVHITASVVPDTRGGQLLYLSFADAGKEQEKMDRQQDTTRLNAQILGILNAIRPAVFWKDKQRRFLGANKAFLDYYGFPSASVIIGKTDEDMGWHEDNVPFRHDEEAVLTTGQRTHRILGKCQNHGEMRDIVASKSPIYDEQHNIIGLAGTFEDVTDERRQRRRIMELNQKLQKSLALLEQANKADKAFFSNVSHDMRTPMNAIVGFTELAMKSGIPAVKQAYLQKISKASKILLQLINDTLEISRLANGKRQPENIVVEPDQLCDSLLTTIQATASVKGVYFHTNLNFQDVAAFRLDQVRLTKILLNLLSNAVKFTPSGMGVNLFGYIVSRQDERHCRLRFIVKDQGKGMSQEFMKRMYKPFEQEYLTENGTGLGLSIVQGLVQLLHGTIDCQSKVGKGTTFTVEVPVEIVPQPTSEQVPQSEEKTTPAANVLQGARILLCEDNALNQEIAVTLLGMKGLQVETAGNGKQGVERYQASAPYYYDGILMDIRMPVMDGLQAARAIRALPRDDAKKVPIIALSANAFPEDVQKSRSCGMNDHLTKPLDVAKICASLNCLIAQFQQKRANGKEKWYNAG